MAKTLKLDFKTVCKNTRRPFKRVTKAACCDRTDPAAAAAQFMRTRQDTDLLRGTTWNQVEPGRIRLYSDTVVVVVLRTDG